MLNRQAKTNQMQIMRTEEEYLKEETNATYFLPVRISHNNTINYRRLPCLSMSIFRTYCIHLQSFVKILKKTILIRLRAGRKRNMPETFEIHFAEKNTNEHKAT